MEKYHVNPTARDCEYIQTYLECHSQTKAAQKCGVGRETIARAVRRAGKCDKYTVKREEVWT